MQIQITIPTAAQIVNGGFEMSVARKNESWKKGQLGDYANRSGVYVHHSKGRILYIGKTTKGYYGTFGERLRREFQYSSSGGKNPYPLLEEQAGPIHTYCLDLDDIDMMVDQGPMSLSPERKTLIMEQALIGVFSPEGNRI